MPVMLWRNFVTFKPSLLTLPTPPNPLKFILLLTTTKRHSLCRYFDDDNENDDDY